MEFDCIYENKTGLDIYEIKWTLREEKEKIIKLMQEKFYTSSLYKKGYRCSNFIVLEVLDVLKLITNNSKS